MRIPVRLTAALLCLSCLGLPAGAEEFDGICIRDLPREGRLLLGERTLKRGDILTAEQARQMTFLPADPRYDAAGEVVYLPISDGKTRGEARAVISFKGKENRPPVAEDSALETYRNIPHTRPLKVSDPEGEALTFTVTRHPRRGTVEIAEDGSCTYTPKKNKVGIDSFTFTAADPGGNVSREATVTVTILKPADPARYADTAGHSCSFAAEWMKSTGIFTGETLGGQRCFRPEAPVTRGEFLTMLVSCLDLPPEEAEYTGFTDEIPQWLKPYLTAAVRFGLTAGIPDPETFGAEEFITAEQAALMLGNVLDTAPAMAEAAPEALLTRAQAAEALYALHQEVSRHPGLLQ